MSTLNERHASLSVAIASEDTLDVRQFAVVERISELFSVKITAVAENTEIDFEAVIGREAGFEAKAGLGGVERTRVWTGVCKEIQEIRTEESGLSTYALEIVPTLWLSTQRRNHRMFQLESDVDIALRILSEWEIEPDRRLSATYKKRKYRVQYGESDFAFVCRLLEDAGVSFFFDDHDGKSRLVLSDAPEKASVREPAIPFRDQPSDADREHVTRVRVGRRIRPGKVTLRDHDYRLPPAYPLLATAKASGVEERLERFHYAPGAFLFESDRDDGTPRADDRGRYRTDEPEASAMAQRRLDAGRSEAFSCTFQSNVFDLAPGQVITIADHPRRDLASDKRLFVVASRAQGVAGKEWSVEAEVRRADVAHRPPLATTRPKVNGVESATVVGPEGEEIHTDEFGRVRVHFHWDRESAMNEESSCWIHVSQPWAGTGYGHIDLPRVGQEVIVDFLGGDPDRPVIVGRVYTNLERVPYTLPEHKTQSGWKSNSTGGTGGYNEIMFEDASGEELVRVQAQRDWHRLVKRDEEDTVGRDRTRVVQRNESVTVGKNRTKQVVQNERVTVGQNQSTTVGANRSAVIGAVDSTTAGDTHVVMIAPGDGAAASSSVTMTDRRIVLDTGAGATITLENAKITLSATTIEIVGSDNVEVRGQQRGVSVAAPSGSTKVVTGRAFQVSSPTVEIAGDTITVGGTTLALTGESRADLTSSGPTTVSGTPLQLNGPGLFAGRVTELAPATITTGAALVLVGGAAFPYPVVRLPDGTLRIGDHIRVKPGQGRYERFQEKVLRDMGIQSTTPAGRQRLENMQNNPNDRDLTIREYTADEARRYGENNSLTYRGAGSSLTHDADGNAVPGAGSDTTIAYNPDVVTGPNGSPEPADGTLYHEMGHSEHNMWGTNRGDEPRGNGWDNEEEYQTIEGGINQPGGTQIDGVPQSPTENDYLGDRNYPLRRTDHGSGYENADGTPITP